MANSDNGALLFDRIAASIAEEYGWKSFTHRLQSPFMMVDLLARMRGGEAVVAWYEGTRAQGQQLPPPLLTKIARGLLLSGKHADAVKLLEVQVKYFPEDAEAHDGLGEGYFKAGRTQEAIASFKKVLSLEPKNTHAVEMLAKLGVKP
jgi:TolA-binding protein